MQHPATLTRHPCSRHRMLSRSVPAVCAPVRSPSVSWRLRPAVAHRRTAASDEAGSAQPGRGRTDLDTAQQERTGRALAAMISRHDSESRERGRADVDDRRRGRPGISARRRGRDGGSDDRTRDRGLVPTMKVAVAGRGQQRPPGRRPERSRRRSVESAIGQLGERCDGARVDADR